MIDLGTIIAFLAPLAAATWFLSSRISGLRSDVNTMDKQMVGVRTFLQMILEFLGTLRSTKKKEFVKLSRGYANSLNIGAVTDDVKATSNPITNEEAKAIRGLIDKALDKDSALTEEDVEQLYTLVQKWADDLIAKGDFGPAQARLLAFSAITYGLYKSAHIGGEGMKKVRVRSAGQTI